MTTLSPIQPAQNDVIRLIESNPELQPSTKMQYSKAVRNYLATGGNLADADALGAYANTISKSSRAFLKAAVRMWGDKIALDAKASATPENVAAVQATVYRVEALNSAIKVEASKGQKFHTWLTQSEVKKIFKVLAGGDVISKRNRIVVGLLTSAGLRREELCNLTFDDIVTQDTRTVLNVKGKGAKNRTVPINPKLAQALAEWQQLAGPGRVARSVTKGGAIRKSLSAIGVFKIVAKAGAAIGKDGLAPHDMRRTYAQLGYEAGVPITQISKLLGHASVATTQRYLNLELNLSETISDFIPFE